MTLARDLLLALIGESRQASREALAERLESDPDYRRRVFDAMTAAELQTALEITDMHGTSFANASLPGRRILALFGRAARRLELGLADSRHMGADRRLVAGSCWFGEASCRCLDRALDHPQAGALGKAGIRRLARRWHGPAPRARQSGAERRRLAAERAAKGRPVGLTFSRNVEQFVSEVSAEPADEFEPAPEVASPPASTALTEFPSTTNGGGLS